MAENCLQDDEDVAVEEIDEETAVKLFGKEGAARLFSGEQLGTAASMEPPCRLGGLLPKRYFRPLSWLGSLKGEFSDVWKYGPNADSNQTCSLQLVDWTSS